MEMLSLFALLYAMIALTRAAALPEAEDEPGTDALPDAEDRNWTDTSTGDSHVVKRSTSCPNGWIPCNGRCFFYVSERKSWAQAEENCLSMGANLVSIHNFNEYHVIQGIIKQASATHGETWIGGSDAEEEGIWLWSDGTTFTYTHWCNGEPNDFQNQNCIHMNYGATKCWDDLECFASRPSVCAKKM